MIRRSRSCSLLDASHALLLVTGTYQYTIEWFGQYSMLQYIDRSSQVSVVLAGIILFLVQVRARTSQRARLTRNVIFQTYYCCRVQRITGSTAIAGACWLLALVRFVLIMCISVTVVSDGTWDALRKPSWHWEMITIQSVGAASDIVIAALICAGMWRMRSGMQASDKLVDKLVAFTIGE